MVELNKQKEMEEIKKYIKYGIGFFIIMAIVLGALTVSTSNKINSSILKEKEELELKISNFNDDLNSRYPHIDSISKSNLMDLRENAFRLEKELHHFEIKKSNEIEELYLSQIKNWAFIIAIITALFIFTGLEWNIKQKVDEAIEKEIKQDVNRIRHTIESEVWLSELRETTKILVLNKSGQINANVKLMLDLTKLEYKKENIENLTWKKVQPKIDGYTAVFIENANSGSDETWDNKEVKKNLKEIGEKIVGKNIPLFYFNTSKDIKSYVRFPTLDEKNYLASFANTEANIYPNLKNLLIVQKLLKENNTKSK